MLIEIVPAQGALGITARAVAGSGHSGEFLAGYLVSDIAGGRDEARDVLAHLAAVASGREPAWTQSGNAYAVTAKPAGVTFDFHWPDEGEPETALVPLADVQAAVTAWLDALERRSVRI